MEITSQHTAIYLTPEEKQLLKAVARSKGLSLSSFIRFVSLESARSINQKQGAQLQNHDNFKE